MLLLHTFIMRGSDVESYNGLGGDSVSDKWTDDEGMDGRTHGKIILLSHTLTMKGSDVASLVEFRPMVQEGRTTDARKDGRTEKINLLLHTLTIRRSDVATLVEFRLVV